MPRRQGEVVQARVPRPAGDERGLLAGRVGRGLGALENADRVAVHVVDLDGPVGQERGEARARGRELGAEEPLEGPHEGREVEGGGERGAAIPVDARAELGPREGGVGLSPADEEASVRGGEPRVRPLGHLRRVQRARARRRGPGALGASSVGLVRPPEEGRLVPVEHVRRVEGEGASAPEGVQGVVPLLLVGRGGVDLPADGEVIGADGERRAPARDPGGGREELPRPAGLAEDAGPRLVGHDHVLSVGAHLAQSGVARGPRDRERLRPPARRSLVHEGDVGAEGERHRDVPLHVDVPPELRPRAEPRLEPRVLLEGPGGRVQPVDHRGALVGGGEVGEGVADHEVVRAHGQGLRRARVDGVQAVEAGLASGRGGGQGDEGDDEERGRLHGSGSSCRMGVGGLVGRHHGYREAQRELRVFPGGEGGSVMCPGRVAGPGRRSAGGAYRDPGADPVVIFRACCAAPIGERSRDSLACVRVGGLS